MLVERKEILEVSPNQKDGESMKVFKKKKKKTKEGVEFTLWSKVCA